MWFVTVLLASLAMMAECGTQSIVNPDSNWRIIGGRNAEEGEFPYQISLLFYEVHHCGGSIVHPEWIITAAHCIIGYTTEYLTVRIGSTKSNSGGTILQVRNMSYNFDFDPNVDGQGDVAILQVDSMEFNELVQPIAIEKGNIGGDVPVTLSGWGTTRQGGMIPEKLNAIGVKTVTVEYCSASHSELPVTDKQVCTLTRTGEGACYGDSGSPLVTGTKATGRKLLGTVSWSTPCAKGKPDVYAKVASYVDWYNGICNCNL